MEEDLKPGAERNIEVEVEQAFATWAHELVVMLYADPPSQFLFSQNSVPIDPLTVIDPTPQIKTRAVTINGAFEKVDSVFFKVVSPVLKEAISRYGHLDSFRMNLSCLLSLLDTQAVSALDIVDYAN